MRVQIFKDLNHHNYAEEGLAGQQVITEATMTPTNDIKSLKDLLLLVI